MQDVVDESGMSFGAVYRYFRIKNDIVMAISLEAIGTVETVIREGVQAGRPVADLMAVRLRALLTLEHQAGPGPGDARREAFRRGVVPYRARRHTADGTARPISRLAPRPSRSR